MRSVVVALVLLSAIVAAVPATTGFAATDTGGTGQHPAAVTGIQPANGVAEQAATPTFVPSSNSPPDLLIEIEIEPDGDARWHVSTFVPLETKNDSRSFDRLAQDFKAGETDGYTAETFEPFVATAEDSTGRTMAIENPERTANVRNDTGVLTVSFTWTNFAKQNGDRLTVKNVFRSESGTWLPELESGHVLVIRPPKNYIVEDSPPGPGVRNATLRWEGPWEFDPDYFADNPITYRRADPSTSQSPTPTTPPKTDDPGGMDLTDVLLGLVVALIVGGALALYLSFDRDDDEQDHGVPGDVTVNGGNDGAALAGEPPADGDTDQAPEPDEDDPFAGVDVDLLSDEERVTRLLEANGGRMKQARIVKETGWSHAKVSQLLSSMDDEEKIDKLRIGRENLISLPDVDVQDDE